MGLITGAFYLRATLTITFLVALTPVATVQAAERADRQAVTRLDVEQLIAKGRNPKVDKLEARLLSASCGACHGTNGHSIGITPVLAGIGKSHFIRQLNDFKSGARPGTVMNRHARGFTFAEIKVLAEFFSSQQRNDCPPGSAPPGPSRARVRRRG